MGIQMHIPHIHRSVRVCWADCFCKRACNHPQHACLMLQGHSGYVIAADGLIVWSGHFVLGRQVHPQLHHLKITTVLSEMLAVVFLMNDAPASSHPLYFALAYGATLSR